VRQSVELRDNWILNRNLKTLSSNLEQRVQERTEELNAKTVLLQESQAQLVASEKLANLGRFTASVAHEVNTPLAASLYDLSHARELVREYKNSILEPNVTKDDHLEIANELEATHQRIESSLERLGRFIRRVREQSRMSSKDSIDFDARQILQDAFVHLEYQAFEHQVKLEISLPTEPVLIHGDPLRLGQVLNELVFRGIQACLKQTEQSTPWVRIALNASHETAILSVEDNGFGIENDALQHFFEPVSANKLGEPSHSLGLSVVHDIVKGHFLGDIQVKSKIEKGTRFEIAIPKSIPNKVNT
jgi:C4-dicarboxylate-specific signal transduction histidine kinase